MLNGVVTPGRRRVGARRGQLEGKERRKGHIKETEVLQGYKRINYNRRLNFRREIISKLGYDVVLFLPLKNSKVLEVRDIYKFHILTSIWCSTYVQLMLIST